MAPSDATASDPTDDSTAPPAEDQGPMAARTGRTFRGRVTVQPGSPIQLSDVEELPPDSSLASETQRHELDAVADTLRQYQKEARALLEGRYSDLASIAPPHLRAPCDCWLVVGEDGIIVRWDKHEGSDKPKIRMLRPNEGSTTMEALSPALSERYVFCVSDLSKFVPPADGQRIELGIRNSATKEIRTSTEVGFAAVVRWPGGPIQPTNRPIPVASVINEVDFFLGGEEFKESAEVKPGTGQEFVLAARIRLAVGWEAFEIYPPFDPKVWRPDGAATWAELDLLAAATHHKLRQDQLNAIDPRAATRREYGRLLKEFESLLDGSEASLQGFLERHPKLLSPTYLDVWRKVQLGEHITDFVFREPTEYLLVELEAPTRRLFRKDGHQAAELTHAIGQVQDWLRYIADNPNTVREELGLEAISSHPSSLIVIGRSGNLSDADRRKLVTMQSTMPKIRILTYDDVLVAATQMIANLLGHIPTTEGAVEIYYRWPTA